MKLELYDIFAEIVQIKRFLYLDEKLCVLNPNFMNMSPYWRRAHLILLNRTISHPEQAVCHVLTQINHFLSHFQTHHSPPVRNMCATL